MLTIIIISLIGLICAWKSMPVIDDKMVYFDWRYLIVYLVCVVLVVVLISK